MNQDSPDDDEFIGDEAIREIFELDEYPPQENASDDENFEMDTDDCTDFKQTASGSANGSVDIKELVDDSVLTFRNHTGEIFAIDLSPNGLVCTGGEDDRAYVWNMETGQILFECTGHKDSVVAVKFNAKHTILATADLCGIVQVWDAINFNRLQSFAIDCDLEWILWHHTADILFCGGSDSAVWMWLVPSGNCKIFSGHGPNCSASCLLPDGKHLCAGYADGTVKIWDLKENTSTAVNGVSCHTNSVTCLSCHPDGNLAASGSEDGTVNLFNVSTGKLIESIICVKKRVSAPTVQQEEANDENSSVKSSDPAETPISVETLAFSTVCPLLAMGTVTGDLLLWDTGARTIRQCFRHSDGVVKTNWIGDLIISACLDGQLRLWNSKSGELVSQWSGHTREILDFSINSDVQRVITVSGDQTAKVFTLKNREQSMIEDSA